MTETNRWRERSDAPHEPRSFFGSRDQNVHRPHGVLKNSYWQERNRVNDVKAKRAKAFVAVVVDMLTLAAKRTVITIITGGNNYYAGR